MKAFHFEKMVLERVGSSYAYAANLNERY